MMLELEKFGLVEMDSREKRETDGGHPFLIVVGIICVGAFCLGVYNGYKDEEAKHPTTVIK